MGEYQDREMLVSDEGIATLLSLSYSQSAGVLWTSAGRILTGAQRLLEMPHGNIELAHDKTVSFLERTEWLGLTSAKHGLDDVRRWRLSDGVVTVLNRVSDIYCDVCKIVHEASHPGQSCEHVKLAIADARTQTGQWGFVCPEHFVTEGCNLGMGKGQLIRPTAQPARKLTYR